VRTSHLFGRSTTRSLLREIKSALLECRFKDIYQLKNLNKDFTEGTYSLKASLAAITRVETCVGLEEELVMALPEQRKNLSVPAGQMIKEIVAQKKGRTIELKFSDQSTCDDLIKLELAH
jgi:hypothetical protein